MGILRRSVSRQRRRPPSHLARPCEWRSMPGRHFEQLEERTLLSVIPVLDYSKVSADWFEAVGAVGMEQETAALYFSSDSAAGHPANSEPLNPAVESQWIVRLIPEALHQITDPGQTEGLFRSLNAPLNVVRGLGLPGQVLVEARGATEATVRAWLETSPYVASFEPNASVTAQQTPDDPEFERLFGLHNTGQTGGTDDADIDAPEAWNITTGSADVVVAVIDSGVDYTHPDLAANIWTNPGEIPSNQIDDDGNGFVDDVHGYDFANNDGDPMDDSRHGTHVAGTIGATGDNAAGVTGVNWTSSIMALKFLDQSNKGTTDQAIRAINYATMMRTVYDVNVRVANNSWGYRGSSSPGLRAAIQASGDAGILFVAAAGNGDVLGRGINNDDDPDHAFYPASEDLQNIISVAASDNDDRLVRFSNYGLVSVDVAAPGVAIFSTEPGDNYRSRYGTSMAAPHVSGVAALVWANAPDATVAEVREAIFLGADSLAELQPKLSTGGRLNAHGALLVDTAAPRATLLSAPNVDGPGVTETLITVEYTDDRLVDVASVQSSRLLVTDVADPSTTFYATFQSVDVQQDAPRCEAVYRLAAPGGFWDTFDNGDYEVSLESDQVRDTHPTNPYYNYTPATVLGTFNVDTTPGLIRVNSTADTPDVNPGDGVSDDGTGHSTLRSAIMEANAQTTVDNVIRIPPGTYNAEHCRPG